MQTSVNRTTHRTTKLAAFVSIALLSLGAVACSAKDTPPADTTATTPAPGNAMAGKEEYTANLTGADERPNPVTTTATGTADLSFTGTGEIAYSVNVNNLSSAASGAHIHGPADANGAAGVLADLSPVGTALAGSLVSGTITATTEPTVSLDSLKALLRSGHAYVNVHTATHKDGEIRGMVTRK